MNEAPRDAAPNADRRRLFTFVVAFAVSAAVLFGAWILSQREPPPDTGISARSTATIVVAVRELARLETTELHMEKVIDLTDTQSRFFGLVEATDALLLVAVGDVTVGVDLGKVQDDDVTYDPKTKKATIRLPQPEIFSTRLDESRTFVYARTTSLVARRNEHLEEKARQAAVAAMEKAAREGDTLDRAKRQAEKELRSLAIALGVSELAVTWR